MPDIDIKIVRHGDPPPWPELGNAEHLATESWKVVILEGGMDSGLPSIGLALEVPGVGTVIAQTSLAAWSGVTIAGRGAFPEAFRGGPLAEPTGYLWKRDE